MIEFLRPIQNKEVSRTFRNLLLFVKENAKGATPVISFSPQGSLSVYVNTHFIYFIYIDNLSICFFNKNIFGYIE